MLNIRDFRCAKEDGTTDDTDAFEAAIYEALPAEDEVHIFIPAGQLSALAADHSAAARSRSSAPSMEVTQLTFKDLASSNATMLGAIASRHRRDPRGLPRDKSEQLPCRRGTNIPLAGRIIRRFAIFRSSLPVRVQRACIMASGRPPGHSPERPCPQWRVQVLRQQSDRRDRGNRRQCEPVLCCQLPQLPFDRGRIFHGRRRCERYHVPRVPAPGLPRASASTTARSWATPTHGCYPRGFRRGDRSTATSRSKGKQ